MGKNNSNRSKNKKKNIKVAKKLNNMKWYLISFYYTDGRITTTTYSAVMLPQEYSNAVSDGKHSIPKPDHVIYIDEFGSERECKAAQDDATLVDSIFKIVEADDKKELEAMKSEATDNKEEI